MKIIITENRLEKVLKQSGVEKTVKIFGGWKNFRNVFNINSFEDYLHHFDDLEEVQYDIFKFRIFRYKSGENIIVYNTRENRVSINDNEIWSVLSDDLLGLKPVIDYHLINYSKGMIQTWLKEVYSIDVDSSRIHPMYPWDTITHLV